MRALLIAVAGTFVVVACSGAGPAVFTDTDTGSHVLVDSGDEFQIRLASNATTGYQWVVAQPDAPVVFTLQDHEYRAPDDDLVGSPGIEIFTFEATEQGAVILRLEYTRPFEEPEIPERVVEFIVRVDDAEWPPPDIGPPPGTSTATAPAPLAP